MKLLQVAEQNKKYYTKEFIHGFNTGAKNQYEADKKDAERRGRWVDIPFTARWICSNCDYISEFASFKYCPDCGARMDLEDEE